MLNRQQFSQYWHTIDPRLAGTGSPLWEIEKCNDHKPSRWFVKITQPISPIELDKFWLWCQQHCTGQVLCYSSASDEEWWGFTDREDIVFWLLKWG